MRQIQKSKPQDATLRNVRATRKTEKALAFRVTELEQRLASLQSRVASLEEGNPTDWEEDSG